MTIQNTFDEFLSEIRMSYPVAKGAVFILLEGESDVRLYRKLFDTSVCKIIWVPGGKSKVEEALLKLVEKYPNIIGIRDADFMHLEGKTVNQTNLFVTDYHDLEMMMVAVDEVFSAAVHEHSIITKSEHMALREALIASIRPIAYIRWLNEKHNHKLNFSGLRFGDLYDAAHQTIDIDTYIHKLIERSTSITPGSPLDLKEKIAELAKESHDSFQLCNGHDFLKLMAHHFTKSKISEVTEKQISSVLRGAYRIDHFQKTNLYRSTQSWAEKNRKTIHYVLE